ncbi:hypothetical protein M427DRAFT_37000 [Gonapodya prolifera JEL478]|uniref:Uncharacterized protein n=1 Tax=Gonapodya prolifera (strain JEL478) TaxID=1344416 RepID=A0A139A115_GONPJ|nr:hypothetical protein M427DRAFT_37000 [Gonapodya prolifera JEL478]|eukprot:KXS10466.1 hypothetical protein M427DRAFT_37000 [Gonapodya prolifera JEL478]
MAVTDLLRRACPVIAGLFYIAVVIALNVVFIKQGQNELKPKGLCANNAYCVDANGNDIVTTYGQTWSDAILVSAHFVSLDVGSEKITFRMTLSGIGKYAANLANVTFVAGDVSKKFDITAVEPGLDATMSATDGDPSTFPFDAHTGDALVYAFIGTQAPGNYIPLGFQNVGFTGSFTAKAFIQATDPTPNQLRYSVGVNVSRSATTKLFAILVAAVQWGLSLGYGLMTTDIRFKGRKLELPILAMGPGLLFAMPGIRNSTPNAPPIGTQLDMASLFFAMAVIGLCLVSNMIRFLWEASHPAPAKPAESKKPDYSAYPAADMAPQGYFPASGGADMVIRS